MSEITAPTVRQDPLAMLLEQGRRVPEGWRTLSIGEMVGRLRDRLDLTQRQLAALSGLSNSRIAKVELGQDLRISTLRKIFMGFGCDVALLPVTVLTAEDLRRRTFELTGLGLIPRRKRYARRARRRRSSARIAALRR